MEVNSRFERQADLVPLAKLAGLRATVIGVGAVGRQVALQLAAIGCPRIQLVDFDQVELTNVTTQGYLHGDIGLAKVFATRRQIGLLDGKIAIEAVNDRFRAKLETGEALFSCVDSISVRETIWRSRQQQVRSGRVFWADGRMLGEVIRVLAAADTKAADHYPDHAVCTGGGPGWALHRPQHDLRGQHHGRLDDPSVHALAARVAAGL